MLEDRLSCSREKQGKCDNRTNTFQFRGDIHSIVAELNVKYSKEIEMSNVSTYCSWCFNKTTHELVEKNRLTRNVYKCTCCQNHTLICRYCSEMAKGQPNPDILKKWI